MAEALKKSNAFAFPVKEWDARSAEVVHKSVKSCLDSKGCCSVMLTGGRSAKRLYASWAQVPGFQQMLGVQFYFGDERCVQPEHPESNYGMAMRVLFRQRVPPGCSLSRLEGDALDIDLAARRYDEDLPEQIDVLLLGVGEDGHIASLFPGSAALGEEHRQVVSIVGPKPPFERLTITPVVLRKATSIFVLAPGPAKMKILDRVMASPDAATSLPACLVSKNTWLMEA